MKLLHGPTTYTYVRTLYLVNNSSKSRQEVELPIKKINTNALIRHPHYKNSVHWCTHIKNLRLCYILIVNTASFFNKISTMLH